jgi:outer membrane receptor protein involved in Fe transport
MELACNDQIFEQAVAFAEDAGGDGTQVDFECRLPKAFLADPPLDEVVTRNFEIGLRGTFKKLSYELAVFHSTNKNEILFQSTGKSTGLFANVDKTQRSGFEGTLRGVWHQLRWFVSYSYIDASFEDRFTALAPITPKPMTMGTYWCNQVIVSPVFQVSRQTQVLNIRWPNPSRLLSISVITADSSLEETRATNYQKTKTYTLANIRLRYVSSRGIEFFSRIDNLFDEKYESFGHGVHGQTLPGTRCLSKFLSGGQV